MNARGHYGILVREAPCYGALEVGQARMRSFAPGDAEAPPDYTAFGVAGGLGLLLGILIGSNITFHTPVRRRH